MWLAPPSVLWYFPLGSSERQQSDAQAPHALKQGWVVGGDHPAFAERHRLTASELVLRPLYSAPPNKSALGLSG